MKNISQLQEIEVCLIGLGPAGLGFLWSFLKKGKLNDLMCIEAGPRIEQRNCPVLNHEYCNLKATCHVIGGFGGSSLLAGGKLSMYPAGTGLNNIVLDEDYVVKKIEESKNVYLENISLKYLSVKEDDKEDARNYYGSLGFEYKYYQSALYTQEEFFEAHLKLQNQFLENGANIWFDTTVVSIERSEDKYLLTFQKNGVFYQILSKKVVMAMGKLGNKFLINLTKSLKLPCTTNKLEIGLRIEFPKKAFDEIDKYHHDLKLKINSCKTFCISKGGKVVLYYKDGLLYTEGYDNYSKPTEFTNLGFLCKVENDDINIEELLKGIEEKRKKEKMVNPIRQTFIDFLNGIVSSNFPFNSSIVNWKAGDINDYLPEFLSAELKYSLEKFVTTFISPEFIKDVSVFFPEINYGGYNYSLSNSFRSIPNFYIIGEGTGRFIGILQSFASGLICSERIIQDG
ncbi:MAG: hypothetical protein M3O71_21660 [Bacteroidota bacterium]|nr:hypothetical protein [Bacteroidota bacterium]